MGDRSGNAGTLARLRSSAIISTGALDRTMIDRRRVLALYDAEMRREPIPEPGARVEHVGTIVRVVGGDNCVLFSDLTAADAREVVSSQANFFRDAGAKVEWKVFGHDLPKDLTKILGDEGFVPDDPETLVAFDLTNEPLGDPRTPGLEIRQVLEVTQLRDALRASEAAFGPDTHHFLDRYRDRLADPTVALFVAYLDGSPAATGRLEMPPGKSFAGLWGGGTSPRFRHRGIYRSLVAARAALARQRGYSFLTVDAGAMSLPILERLGFVPLTTTRGWILHPPPRRLP
jgi:GNAT superfamily N-acetyltransferase